MHLSPAAKAVAATLLFLAGGPAAIVGGVIGVSISDHLVATTSINGRTRIFDAIPVGLAGFLLGALATLVVLATAFVAVMRSKPTRPTLPFAYAAPPAPRRSTTQGLAIGVTFVIGAGVVTVAAIVGIFLVLLSMSPHPM